MREARAARGFDARQAYSRPRDCESAVSRAHPRSHIPRRHRRRRYAPSLVTISDSTSWLSARSPVDEVRPRYAPPRHQPSGACSGAARKHSCTDRRTGRSDGEVVATAAACRASSASLRAQCCRCAHLPDAGVPRVDPRRQLVLAERDAQRRARGDVEVTAALPVAEVRLTPRRLSVHGAAVRCQLRRGAVGGEEKYVLVDVALREMERIHRADGKVLRGWHLTPCTRALDCRMNCDSNLRLRR